MTRGFDAVVRALAQEEDGTPGKLLTLAGKTLVSSVGGASGPLWGSALRRGGRALGDAQIFNAESSSRPSKRRSHPSSISAPRCPVTRPWSMRCSRP